MGDNVLDEEILRSEKPDSDNLASATTRFLTFLIDIVIYYTLSAVAGVFIGIFGDVNDNVLVYTTVYTIYALYYIILEGTTGRTIGKMIMKTKVVTLDGEKPTFGQAFIRTISRFVPFEFISDWMDDSVMWHDKWASTRVVKIA